jgi:hypothetical protein
MTKREMQNELAQRCFNAILENDSETVKELLKNGLKPFSIYPSSSSANNKQVIFKKEGTNLIFKKTTQKAIVFSAQNKSWDITKLLAIYGNYHAKDITETLEIAILLQQDSLVHSILENCKFFIGKGLGTKSNIVNYMLHYGEQYLSLFETFHIDLYQENNSNLFIALQKDDGYLFEYLLREYYCNRYLNIESIINKLISFENCLSHEKKIVIFFNYISSFPELYQQVQQYINTLNEQNFKKNLSSIDNYSMICHYMNKINLFEKIQKEQNNYDNDDETISKI